MENDDKRQPAPASEVAESDREILLDLRKRLGRIEKNLISYLYGNPAKPRKVPER